MECFVCNKPAEVAATTGDAQSVSCPQCGEYRVTGTVIGLLERGRWLHTAKMQQWLEEQRTAGVACPVINSDVAEFDGVWMQG